MTRSRYFKNSGKSKPSFQWTGSPVTASPSRPPHLMFYSSFTVGELTASVGDHVLIRSTDSMNQEILECEVARLDRLYEDFDNKSDPYRAVVTWLCRPKYLPRNMHGSHGMEEEGALPFNNEHEVVGEAREFENDISAETIYSKCTVVTGGVQVDPAKFSSSHKKGPYPCYLHRFNMTMVKKNKYSMEPVLSAAKKSQTKKRVLRSRSASPVSPRQTVTPLRVNVVELRLGKRKISVIEGGSERKRTRASTSKETSPELSSFVVGTPTAVFGTPDGRSRRTPKPRKSMDYEALVGINERMRTRHKSTPARMGNIISTERFTQVETATGSGRKITIKCGDKKKFATSSGLAGKQISTMLDSESDDSEAKLDKSKKVSTQLKRTRRASISCTTPTRLTISTVTPKKSITRRRPASEMKKSSKSNLSSDDDDFQPIKAKPNCKKVPVSSKPPPRCSSTSSSESESDAELPVKRKASTQPPTKNTPGPKTYSKRVFKPSVAPRAKPLPANVDPLTEAQQRLHVSAVPSSLPCREEEFAEIFGYVESKLQEGTGGCFYISGVPGTGKTATVMEVIRYLKDNNDDYPDFNFYSMNGMRLTSPEQAYVEMWSQLTKEKATPEHAMKLLDTRFNTKAPKRISTIFLVDELDMLCNKKQSVLYNMFDWPSKPHGKLIVLAIANTMDLPERVMINRVSSRLGLTRQTFQPYTHTQLQTIVASRLEGLEVFKQDAIQLVARKVASLSGDARRALDICRRATEMAESMGQSMIGVVHVTKAHQEMFSSPKILAIRSCTKYEQLLLKVMVSEFHRTGVEETTVGAIFREMQTCLRTEGVETMSLPGTVAMVARLAATRLLLSEHMKHGLETKLRLNVATEEINFALKSQEEGG
eukprot:GFUD01001653.1.p1 GENE.GFUD01001653.1~~GFUD01001653.1.p1  ORF type:complete len:880 (+),score=263.06 GFUD01001653.1:116-2755(+)